MFAIMTVILKIGIENELKMNVEFKVRLFRANMLCPDHL
jgi:hypothetical protein